MAKKKEPTFQIECRTDQQWRAVCRRDGLIVADVYAGWTGPCSSIINFLKRVKADIPADSANKLTFVIACSDKIDDLIGFKDQSEPTWLFLAGGGKPIRVMRGCHVPNLAKAIKDELDHELLCMEGKARRNLITIEDDDIRKKKMEGEAMRLGDMLKDEEAPPVDEKARRESSIQLETVMAAYTIAVVQPFLHSRLNEIKEFLTADFNILSSSTVKIDDENARKIYRIPYEATLPKDVIGKTTFLLLESTEIKKILEGGGKLSGALQTADDWLRLKVGPRVFEQALEHSPSSLHATYGKKGQYLSGVWCPRRYDDKRFILVTYFSEFMIDKFMPAHPNGDPDAILEKFQGRQKKRIPEKGDKKPAGGDAAKQEDLPPLVESALNLDVLEEEEDEEEGV